MAWDPLEVLMGKFLIQRGVPEHSAQEAARRCASAVERGLVRGAVVTLLATYKYNVVAMGAATVSGSLVMGGYEFLTSEACAPVRDAELMGLVDQVNSGY